MLTTARSLGTGAIAALLASAPTAQLECLPNMESVENYIESFLEPDFAGGCGLILVQGGQLIYARTFGDFDFDRVIPIASSTKWWSGLTIAEHIARSNDLQPNTRLAEYVDSFDVPLKRQITLEQCFSHSSGLPDGPAYQRDPSLTMEQAANLIADLTLQFAPGDGIAYGGAGMQAAAFATVQATGTDWNTLFDQTIAQPLGLTSTDYFAFTPGGVPTDNPNVAGSLRTSMREYARFLAMLQNRGAIEGQQIVSREATDLLFKNITDPDAPIVRSPYEIYEVFVPGTADYRTGFGCFLDPSRFDDAGRVRWATSAGAFGTNAWIDLDRSIAGVLMVEQYQRDSTPGSLFHNPASRRFIEGVRPLIEQVFPVILADINADGGVDADDFFTVIQFFGSDDRDADIDGDGTVDADDFFTVIQEFGRGCPR